MSRSTSSGPVLVATEPDDRTADMVIAELNRRGVPVVRFNPADIGGGLRISARFGTHPASGGGRLRTPSRDVDLAGVRSLYWRRPGWPAFDHLDPPEATFAAAQVHHGLGGILYGIPASR